MDLPDVIQEEDRAAAVKKVRIAELEALARHYRVLMGLYESPSWKEMDKVLRVRYDSITNSMVKGDLSDREMHRAAGAAKEVAGLLVSNEQAKSMLRSVEKSLEEEREQRAL